MTDTGWSYNAVDNATASLGCGRWRTEAPLHDVGDWIGLTASGPGSLSLDSLFSEC